MRCVQWTDVCRLHSVCHACDHVYMPLLFHALTLRRGSAPCALCPFLRSRWLIVGLPFMSAALSVCVCLCVCPVNPHQGTRSNPSKHGGSASEAAETVPRATAVAAAAAASAAAMTAVAPPTIPQQQQHQQELQQERGRDSRCAAETTSTESLHADAYLCLLQHRSLCFRVPLYSTCC